MAASTGTGNLKTVSHRGRIIGITPDVTRVEIISESACASCHSRNFCSLGEASRKIVEVPTSGWDNYKVGQEVNVELVASLGHKAVWLAYAIPLVILIAVILACISIGLGELVSGLASILAVVVYYFVLFCFRNSIRREYVFKITDNN